MNRSTLLLALVLTCTSLARAIDPVVSPSYEHGMELIRQGKPAEAKAVFKSLLEADPESNGALEGLSLSCLALGEYTEAQTHLEKWNSKSPKNAYILGLLGRAYANQRMPQETLRTLQAQTQADPTNERAWEQLDSLMRTLHSGLFPSFRLSQSVGPEGLNSPSPQRVAYVHRSARLDGRYRLRPALDALAGVEVANTAQRNDTRGFTYFDILEQIYSAGLSYHPTPRWTFEGGYGQSVLSNVHEAALAETSFSRARALVSYNQNDTRLTAKADRRPYFLRGTGSSRFFELLKQWNGEAIAETRWADWDWRLVGGADFFSDGTDIGYGSFMTSREFRDNTFQGRLSHGYEEFFGATPSGRFGYVEYDRASLRYRRSKADRYTMGTGYAYTDYRDDNHENEVDAEVTGWLPIYPMLGGVYRFSWMEFGSPATDYLSTNERNHWLGARWHSTAWRGLWTTVGYEHGFRFDTSRRSYEDNTAYLSLRWVHTERWSFEAEGRWNHSNANDLSHLARASARYSF